jgi:hypothetical protein
MEKERHRNFQFPIINSHTCISIVIVSFLYNNYRIKIALNIKMPMRMIIMIIEVINEKSKL